MIYFLNPVQLFLQKSIRNICTKLHLVYYNCIKMLHLVQSKQFVERPFVPFGIIVDCSQMSAYFLSAKRRERVDEKVESLTCKFTGVPNLIGIVIVLLQSHLRRCTSPTHLALLKSGMFTFCHILLRFYVITLRRCSHYDVGRGWVWKWNDVVWVVAQPIE